MFSNCIRNIGIATTVVIAASVPVCSQENVEDLVTPAVEQLKDATAPKSVVSPSTLMKIKSNQTHERTELKRMSEEAQAAIQRRHEREESDYRNRDDEYRRQREKYLENADRRRFEVQNLADETSRSLGNRMVGSAAIHAAIKGTWDAEAERDLREFRAKYQADLAKRIAEGERMGKMLIALLSGGMGMDAGGLASMFQGMGGAEQGMSIAAEAGSESAILDGGAISGINTAAETGPSLVGEQPAEAVRPPLLASLDDGPSSDAVMQDTVRPTKLSEIAYRPPMNYRPYVRPIQPTARPRNRDPKRNDPVLAPRQTPPINWQGKQTLDGLGEFLDTMDEKSKGLESLHRLTGKSPGRSDNLILKDKWHPPLLLPTDQRPQIPIFNPPQLGMIPPRKGPEFMAPKGPRYGEPVRIQHPWVDDPEYDLYVVPGLEGQPSYEIPVHRFIGK